MNDQIDVELAEFQAEQDFIAQEIERMYDEVVGAAPGGCMTHAEINEALYPKVRELLIQQIIGDALVRSIRDGGAA